MKPILAIDRVTKRFGGLTAVDEVSFELFEGEILGLIGPNGAGKTTVVSLISGTIAPSAGKVLFQGAPIAHLPAFRRSRLGIGRTFQLMKPFPGLDVLDNVAIGALFGTGGGKSQLRQARDDAAYWLDFVGLGHRSQQRAEELGGPDRKRLELAKALAMNPRLLLLDEVMAGLHHVEIDEVVTIIKRVRSRGITILLIEHVMKAIQSLSDRVLVLHHGSKIAEGSPQSVLDDPRVVDAYLGSRRK
ncbi:MAG TPA: ABC transporter ATP-binding protein [Burkholderiaceae bacterium]|nr:ABC transporter ATP-binding protein [Burkholderiaceae bacterium]